MTTIGSPSPFLLGATAPSYDVDRSLRFSSVGETRLNYTPSSDGNRKKWTWAAWIKRGNIDRRYFWSAYTSGPNVTSLQFHDTGALNFEDWLSGYRFRLTTAGKFRDPSAWFHLVVYVDTAQSTASDRVKMYINGVEPEFENAVYPTQNLDTKFNTGGLLHAIGTEGTNQRLWFDGYMAEVYFLDGYAYDSSYFGETNAATGQWIPKEYTGSFGNNGYYLKFADNSSTSALGTDSSGNGNNLTPVNFSVSDGIGDDSVEDTPTNNWCTLNPLHHRSINSSFSNANLQVTIPASNSTGKAYGSFVVYSGKWYWELKYTGNTGNYLYVGVSGADGHSYQRAVRGSDGELIPNTGTVSVSYTTNDIIMVALDVDNGKWYIGKNGSFMLSGDPVNGTGFVHSGLVTTNNGLTAFFQNATSTGSQTFNINFGQQGFTYTPPTGFVALNSANLSEPTIKFSNKYFGTLLYSSGSSNGTFTFTNTDTVDFFPDWTWIKCRDAAESHYVIDAVRGNQNITNIFLKPNGTDNETGSGVNGTTVSSIQNGIKIVETSINNSQGGGEIYYENRDYVTWNWNAGDTDSKTYTVTVVSDSGNKYRFDGFGTSAVTLDLAEGGTYTFNYPSAHPLRFSTTSDGTHGGGSEYTTGVSSYGDSVTITVAASAPTLYYYCTQHSGMGGAINTNSTLGSSNFDGSIQTTVKVNTSSGFSIVTFSGSGNRTIGHGLGVAPQVIIMKGRNVSDQWTVGHQELDASNPWHKGIPLNTDASTQDNSGFWNDTAPTSTVFSKGTWDEGYNMVAYCFSEVAGYSKFGSYTGNGSSDGTFVFTGFTPAWLLTKRTNSSASWEIHDNQRPAYNPHSFRLLADGTNTEATSNHVDFVSNGFKIRNTFSGMNGSNGDTYIYLAFAKAPFKYARGM